ncbi:hypothetical protein FRC05_005961 [Tulasnella sp. 425]|nr:hypothetical protein FRC05_005961 [Tulasnella sp. 425]
MRSVGKYWMEIVDPMHELWTRVSLTHDANLLSMILQKSSTQSRSILYKREEFDFIDGASTSEEKTAGFLQYITPSAGRWKSLEYCARPDAQHERMLGLPLHNLETLTVHIARTAVNYSGVFDAPRLRELDVCRLSLSNRTLSDLRSLQIDSCVPGPSVDKVHNILKTSPGLEVLELARTMTSPTGHLTDLDDTH